MKKTVKMIGMACLMGAFAFLGSSCNKEKTEGSVKVNMPTVGETTINEGERAYIDYSDGMKMKWSAGDEIMVYNLNSDYTQSIANVYTLTSGADSQSGNFHGEAMGSLMDSYYAFYPASKVVNYPLGPNNAQTFEVPAEQTRNGATMDPTSLVMAAKGDNLPAGNFNMDHIFGFINLKMKGTQAVQKIELIDNAFNLTGNVTLELPMVDSDNLTALQAACTNSTVTWEAYLAQMTSTLQAMGYTSEPTGKMITLNCDGVELSADTYTDFIFSLRPGALAKGFQVKVYYVGQDEPVVINKYNPDSDGYVLAAYPQYPRGFAITPGFLLNAKLN